MAKKTLLSEGQVRKFMKLAAIGPLTENFLAEADEDGEMDAEIEGGGMDAEMEGGEEGAEEAEMPAAEAEAALMGLAEKLKVLADALGVEMTVGGEMETDDSGDEELEEGYMTEEGDEDLYEELNESVKVIDPQRITKEVSRRVAQRLIKESKQEKLAEALAAKIAARLR